MPLDPTTFATVDERGQIRTAQFQQNVGQLKADNATPPGLSDALDFGQQTANAQAQPNPGISAGMDFASQLGSFQQQSSQDLTDLQRRAAALQLTQPDQTATEESRQSALGAAANAGIGALNTVMSVLDFPRKMTFEHLVLPLARRLGVVGENEQVDPTGRDLILHAFGGSGEQLDQYLTNALKETWGWGQLPAGIAGSIPTRLGGLVLDIAFDPLSYLTLGGEGLIKAGGRTLAEEGVALANAVREPAVQGARRLPEILGALQGPVADLTTKAADAQALVAANRTKETASAAQAATEALSGAQEITRKLGTQVGGAFPEALTEPQIDQMFSLLRGTGVQADLFAPGGIQFRLPANLAALHIPVLNREEQFGVLLGGHEIAPAAARKLDGLRQTAIDLGSGALAKVPVGAQVASLAAAGGAGLATGNLPLAVAGLGGALLRSESGRNLVQQLFVPYYYLQGMGRDALTEALKRLHNVPRVEAETAAKAVGDIFHQKFGEVTPDELARVQSHLDIGAVVTDAQGNPVYETFDELARRMNQAAGGTPPIPESAATIQARLESQREHLQAALQTIANVDPQTGRLVATKPEFEFAPPIPVRDLSGIRPAALAPGAPGTELPAAEILQGMIDNTAQMIATGMVPKRYATRDLVEELRQAVAQRAQGANIAPTTLEQIEPSQRVRDILGSLLEQEQNVFGMPGVQGPVSAIMQEAMQFGQGGFLVNYLRHIHDVDAPGIAKTLRNTLPQLGLRTPANIGQQRVTSFLAEPEGLQALGYLTNPEAVVAKTLAQYKTTARESQFVQWVLRNYGRPFQSGQALPDGWGVFKPEEWFTHQLPTGDELDQMIRAGKLAEPGKSLDPIEAQALLSWQAGKQANRARRTTGPAYILPSDVIRGLQENRKIVQNAGGVFAILDSALAVQRSLVTTIWPAYHFRNLVGNLVNSHLGGVDMTDMRRMADAAQFIRGTQDPAFTTDLTNLLARSQPNATAVGRLGALDLSKGNVMDWFRKYLEERGVLRTGQLAVDTTVARAGDALPARALNAVNDFAPFKVGRTAAEFIDNTMRVRHVLSRLDAGDSLEQAVLSAKKYLFDFSDLTPAEKQWLRPSAFFYSWTRKNLPLQLEMLVHEPREAQYWNDAFRAFNDNQMQKRADAALMPAWVREQLGLVAGQGPDGALLVASSFGLPIEDINQFSASNPGELARKFLGMTNPLLQTFVGMAGTPTSFTNRTIGDDAFQNYYRQLSPIYGQLAQQVPGLAKAIDLNAREIVDNNGNPQTIYTANPNVLFALHNVLSLGRVLRTVGQGVDAVRNPHDPRSVFFGLRTLTGVNVNPVDVTRPLESLGSSLTTQEIDQDTAAKLEELSRKFNTGEITSDYWRQQRSDLLAARQHQRDLLLKQQLAQEGIDLSSADAATIQKYRSSFVDEGQRLLDLAYSIDPNGDNPLTGKPFATRSEFVQTRAALLDRVKQDYPTAAKRLSAVQDERLKNLPPNARQDEMEYQQAINLLTQYENVPKYLGLNKDQAAAADRATALLRAYSTQYGPGAAKALVYQRDPEGLLLSQRAKLNPQRQLVWRKLNQDNNGLLNRYFRNIPAEDAAGQAFGQVPAFATGVRDFGGGPALVGEAGREQIVTPRGQFTVDAPTVLNLPAHTDVLPASQMDLRPPTLGVLDGGTAVPVVPQAESLPDLSSLLGVNTGTPTDQGTAQGPSAPEATDQGTDQGPVQIDVLHVVPPARVRSLPGDVQTPDEVKGMYDEQAAVPDVIANSPGVRLDAEGLHVPVSRYQKPQYAGQRSVRGSVYYSPSAEPDSGYHAADNNVVYGGSQPISGETVFKRPLMVISNGGGEAAFDAAWQVLPPDEVERLDLAVHKAATASDQGALADLFHEQGMSDAKQLAAEIVRAYPDPKTGDAAAGDAQSKRYIAAKEALWAGVLRQKGYDGIVSVTDNDAPGTYRIREIADLRESHYPTPEGGYQLHLPELSPPPKDLHDRLTWAMDAIRAVRPDFSDQEVRQVAFSTGNKPDPEYLRAAQQEASQGGSAHDVMVRLYQQGYQPDSTANDRAYAEAKGGSGPAPSAVPAFAYTPEDLARLEADVQSYGGEDNLPGYARYLLDDLQQARAQLYKPATDQ